MDPHHPTSSRPEPERAGLSLARIGGTELRIDPSWFFIFALVWLSLALGYFPRTYPGFASSSYWSAGALASLLFFASVVAHELSHAWMARRAGIEVPTITLFLFGGVAQMKEEAKDPATELRIAAMGPLASFALAGFFGLLHAGLGDSVSPLAAGVVRYLAWINAALGIFNLLPGLPLDGGRILRAWAWRRSGSLREGTRVAANAGKGIALGLMALGALQIFGGALIGGIWLVLIGLFLRGTAEAGYQGFVLRQSFENVSVREVAILDPVTVPPEISLQTLVNQFVLHHGYRSYPVVADGRVLGVITIDALRDLDGEKRRGTAVSERMTPLSDDTVVAPDLPLGEAFEKLARASSGRLLVMEGDRLVGLLTKEALTRFVEIRDVLGGGKPR